VFVWSRSQAIWEAIPARPESGGRRRPQQPRPHARSPAGVVALNSPVKIFFPQQVFSKILLHRSGVWPPLPSSALASRRLAVKPSTPDDAFVAVHLQLPRTVLAIPGHIALEQVLWLAVSRLNHRWRREKRRESAEKASGETAA
jgi:hypothetical protein